MVIKTPPKKITKHRHFRKFGQKELDSHVDEVTLAFKEVDDAFKPLTEFVEKATKSPALRSTLVKDISFIAGERVAVPNPLKRPIEGFRVAKSTAAGDPFLLVDQPSPNSTIWMSSDYEGVVTLEFY